MKDPRVIVALDFPQREKAVAFAMRLDPAKCRVKVGKELFTAAGPAVVDDLQKVGYEVFLDLKFHDIPNTVAGAVRSACGLGVWMTSIHTSGGRKMMEAAMEAADKYIIRPLIIGITVLTSMDADDLKEVGVSVTPSTQVLRLARLGNECDLDGVVCSGQEAGILRGYRNQFFKLVTPGIRLPGSDSGDQSRILTPQKAIAEGSDYLVIGRPITGAPNPMEALDEINTLVDSALTQSN